MYAVYSALLAIALLLTLPYWLMQMSHHGKYRAGLWERLGKVPGRLAMRPEEPTIWIHAVSVGEVLAVIALVAELKRRHQYLRIVVSTTTDTGQKLARKEFGEKNVFYFPLDFAFAIRPYLRAVRPQLLILAETEFWPNILRLAHNSGTRIAVVNGRISDRSWPNYRRFRGLLTKVLNNIDLFLAQTKEDARRLAEIGALPERVQVTGNLKFDAPSPPEPPILASIRQKLHDADAGPMLVCGSTVEGEERILLQAFENVLASYPHAMMILAPRHPERFTAVAQLLEELGIRFWRRSLWSGEALTGGVFLLDSIGELAALYALADIAFVGGSLVPRGGHNILEAARHGVPIVVGPHTENFRDTIRLFESQQAVRIATPAELPLVFMDLIANENVRNDLGQRAAQTLRSQTGATQRTADAIDKLLPGHSADFSMPLSDVPAAHLR